MPYPKVSPATTNVIVSQLFTIIYRNTTTGDTISLQSASPFVTPQLNTTVDIEHNGIRVTGKVKALTFGNNTFPDGAGYGSREYIDVEIT